MNVANTTERNQEEAGSYIKYDYINFINAFRTILQNNKKL